MPRRQHRARCAAGAEADARRGAVDRSGLGLRELTVLAPARAGAMLDRASALLERCSRAIVIVLGLVFGTWFLVKALGGFGIL